jgi:hypothetical protein
MEVGNLIGVRDVVAVRLFQALLVGLLSAITFHVARIYLRNGFAAVIAFMFALTSPKFAQWMVVGTQPKLPMILFGMLTLLLIAKDKPFLAGASSMMSCLCWQPGLMFTGVAFLIFTRYLTSWRDGRALKVIAGAVVPLAVVVAYFYWRGALDDLWAWTITYNYSVFGPDAQRVNRPRRTADLRRRARAHEACSKRRRRAFQRRRIDSTGGLLRLLHNQHAGRA